MSATFDAIRTEFEYQIRTSYARGLAAGKHGTRSDDAETVEAIDRAAKKVLGLIEGQPEAQAPSEPSVEPEVLGFRFDEAHYFDTAKSRNDYRSLFLLGSRPTAPRLRLPAGEPKQHPELLQAVAEAVSPTESEPR